MSFGLAFGAAPRDVDGGVEAAEEITMKKAEHRREDLEADRENLKLAATALAPAYESFDDLDPVWFATNAFQQLADELFLLSHALNGTDPIAHEEITSAVHRLLQRAESAGKLVLRLEAAREKSQLVAGAGGCAVAAE